MGDESNRRKQVRYYPDDGTFAQIDTNPDRKSFSPDLTALVLEQSQKGCGLVMLDKDFQQIPEEFLLQIGNLGPLKGKMRWNQAIDEKIRKVGIEYL